MQSSRWWRATILSCQLTQDSSACMTAAADWMILWQHAHCGWAKPFELPARRCNTAGRRCRDAAPCNDWHVVCIVMIAGVQPQVLVSKQVLYGKGWMRSQVNWGECVQRLTLFCLSPLCVPNTQHIQYSRVVNGLHCRLQQSWSLLSLMCSAQQCTAVCRLLSCQRSALHRL